MKTRHGFVSNSSSSSFIVHDPNRTTAQIMREMLKLVKREWKEERYNTRSITKVIKWLQAHPKKNIPLVYPRTCNYETWVYKTANGMDTMIETCNNHDCNWESMEDFAPVPEGDYDEEMKHMKSLKFLDLEDMKEKTYDEYNKEWQERFDAEIKARSKK